jgi:hypothetical protein
MELENHIKKANKLTDYKRAGFRIGEGLSKENLPN